jgi:hypothetical protein
MHNNRRSGLRRAGFGKDAAAECQDVEETVLRYFGMYNPRAAAKGQGVGRYETPERR